LVYFGTIFFQFSTKINGHLSSNNHLTNIEKMNCYQKTKETGSVVAQLSFHQEEVTKNRMYMSYLIEIVLYLAKQGMPYRGHDEKFDSLNQDNNKSVILSVLLLDIRYLLKTINK